MNVEQRLRLIRVIEKIKRNPEFSEKLGIRDQSKLKSRKEEEE